MIELEAHKHITGGDFFFRPFGCFSSTEESSLTAFEPGYMAGAESSYRTNSANQKKMR